MTYSNWKVKRDGRTREGLDELNVLSTNEHNNCHDLDIRRTPDTATLSSL
jgi:hypothetical protein